MHTCRWTGNVNAQVHTSFIKLVEVNSINLPKMWSGQGQSSRTGSYTPMQQQTTLPLVHTVGITPIKHIYSLVHTLAINGVYVVAIMSIQQLFTSKAYAFSVVAVAISQILEFDQLQILL